MFQKTQKTSFKMDFSLLLTLLPKRLVEALRKKFSRFFAKPSEDGFLTIFVDNCHCSADKDACLRNKIFHHFKNRKQERSAGYPVDIIFAFFAFSNVSPFVRSLLDTLSAHVYF